MFSVLLGMFVKDRMRDGEAVGIDTDEANPASRTESSAEAFVECLSPDSLSADGACFSMPVSPVSAMSASVDEQDNQSPAPTTLSAKAFLNAKHSEGGPTANQESPGNQSTDASPESAHSAPVYVKEQHYTRPPGVFPASRASFEESVTSADQGGAANDMLQVLPNPTLPEPHPTQDSSSSPSRATPLSASEWLEMGLKSAEKVQQPMTGSTLRAEALPSGISLATSVVQPIRAGPILEASERQLEAGSRFTPDNVWSAPGQVGPYPVGPRPVGAVVNLDMPRPVGAVVKLDLAQVLPEPYLGSPDCPTAGSMNHRWGSCKPCAFLHTKGCANGVDCTFCHICDPGEKKRRLKEKKEQKRELAKWMEQRHPTNHNYAAHSGHLGNLM